MCLVLGGRDGGRRRSGRRRPRGGRQRGRRGGVALVALWLVRAVRQAVGVPDARVRRAGGLRRVRGWRPRVGVVGRHGGRGAGRPGRGRAVGVGGGSV